MSDETPERDDDIVLAGEYALGLLSEKEAAAFAARLAVEPELRAIHAAWVEDFAAMAEEVEPVAPPPAVRSRVEERLFAEQEQARRPGLFRRFAPVGLAAAVVLALLFLAPDMVERGPVVPSDPAYRAEIAAEDRKLVIAAAYDDATAALHLRRAAGEAPSGRVLELWLIAGDDAPVSLGVLPDAGDTVVQIPEDLRPALEGGVLAVSEEPPGGSPTGAPTGEVLATGPITNA